VKGGSIRFLRFGSLAYARGYMATPIRVDHAGNGVAMANVVGL
jgi:hypothetical protein